MTRTVAAMSLIVCLSGCAVPAGVGLSVLGSIAYDIVKDAPAIAETIKTLHDIVSGPVGSCVAPS